MEPTSRPSRNSLAIPIAIVISAAIIGGAIILGALILRHGDGDTFATNDATEHQPSQTANIAKVSISGEPFIGNSNAAVTIAYWYDYQCPFCRRNEETTMPQIVKAYVDTGKAKVVFKDFEFLGSDSQALGKFSRAVWAAAPRRFYQWHKAVFDNQGKENSGWATHEKIMSITTGVLGANLANKINQLVTTDGDAYQRKMDKDKAEGVALGVRGTPAFIIGKHLIEGAQPYAAIKQVIDITIAEK